MPERYASPQDAEDAFYDAIDERNAARLRGVWDDSADIACLLPMQPLLVGDPSSGGISISTLRSPISAG
jgi:hypothetical protein